MLGCVKSSSVQALKSQNCSFFRHGFYPGLRHSRPRSSDVLTEWSEFALFRVLSRCCMNPRGPFGSSCEVFLIFSTIAIPFFQHHFISASYFCWFETAVRNRPPRLSSLVCWRHLGSCPLQSFQMCLHVSVDPRLYIFLVWTPDEIILFVLFWKFLFLYTVSEIVHVDKGICFTLEPSESEVRS